MKIVKALIYIPNTTHSVLTRDDLLIICYENLIKVSCCYC